MRRGTDAGRPDVSSAVVDLRSDTVTRPTEGMRAAMAHAEVGDDVLDGDPTTIELERTVAELLGKDAALFVPSGIMANQIAIGLLAERGTEMIAEATSHVVDWELGAAAAWWGVQLGTVPGDDGLLDPAALAAAVRPPSRLQLRTSALALENTHNGAGGRVLPFERMRALHDVARTHALRVHLDGARIWHAAVATGTPERAWAELADTVTVTLSKGLGCPVGSLLALDSALLYDARVLRRRLGGAMRQSGILAAAGLYALDHHRERLADDHARARRLADACAAIDGLRVIAPETNIVMMDVARDGLDANIVVQRAREAGVLLTAFTNMRVRAVTHMDVGDEGIERAAEAIAGVIR
jgi:threonine aldolase